MSYKNGKKSNVYTSADGYDLWAKYYDKSEGFLNSFERDIFMRILGNPEGRIMDLGCGTGRLIKALAHGENEVTGVDISEEMLSIARKKFPRIEFIKASSENLPFGDESFDMIVASFFVVHLKDLRKTFDEAYRVLKSDGIFILTNINQKKAPKLQLEDKEEIVIKSYYHRPEDIVKSLESSFFSILREEFVEEEGVWINQIIKAKK